MGMTWGDYALRPVSGEESHSAVCASEAGLSVLEETQAAPVGALTGSPAAWAFPFQEATTHGACVSSSTPPASPGRVPPHAGGVLT